MRVAIIGSGQIARLHGSLILRQTRAEIVGIADPDITRAKALAAVLKVSQFYQDAKVMIDEQGPDVVHILAPPRHHAELSVMAMTQGCHVLVEKPMALTMADAEKMVKVARETKMHLCVDHNMVFGDLIQQAISLTSKGLIGDVVSVEACYLYDPRRYPAILEEGAEYCHWSYQLNGGPLQDQMPHPASLVMEFIHEIKEVKWLGQNRGVLPEGWQDEIRVLVKSDRVIGCISISLSEKPDTFSLVIKGTKGTLDIDLFTNILTLQKKSGLPRAVARGLSGSQLTLQYLRGSLANISKLATGHIDKSNGIGPLIARFYESIRNGGAVPVSLDKSLRVVDLMTRIWPVPMRVTTKQPNSFRDGSRKQPAGATALVTGASGFIGTHLVHKLLSENIRVRALVRPNSSHGGRLKKIDVDIVEGDLADAEVLYEAAKGVKTIYHAGAAMSNSWEEHYQTTIKGTENLIKASLAHQVERFVQLSTLGVYELVSLTKNAVIKEDSPYQRNPQRMGPYTYAKIMAEKLIFDAYHQQRLGVTVVRPGIVIGPLGRVFFPHLGYHYRDKMFLLIGKNDHRLPLTYVENTVDGIYKASINDNAIGQAYNLVDDDAITTRTYLERFIKITGIHARIISLPYTFPYLAGTAYEMAVCLGLLKNGVTSRAQLKAKQVRALFDNAKAKNELEWKPMINLDEGLRRTFEWYTTQQGSRI
jgi:2-alkyl-3-oxoalkanoate reductase